jgi:ATP-binding cassette, subfamily B, multidrug efflux pump
MILWNFFNRYWPVYLLGIILLIATDLLSLLIPRAVGQAVDIVGKKAVGNLDSVLYLLMGVAAAMAVMRFFYREYIIGTTRRLEYYLRNTIFQHALRLPMRVYDEAGPGKIMALAVNDVTSVRVAIGLGIMLLVDAVIMGILAFGVMFHSIDPLLTLCSVAPLPFVFFITAILGRQVHQRFRKVQEKFSTLTEYTQELFGGIKVLKAFGAENTMKERFESVNTENMTANMALARVQAIYVPVTHVAPLLCYAVALWMGGGLIVKGSISVGEFAAFTGYLGLIIWPVMGLGYLINTVQRGAASLQRITAFLATQEYEIEEQPVGKTEQSLLGDIEFRNLTFQYPLATSPSLKDVSFVIPSGATVGIVGRTGSGKTTLLRILLRLYPIADGKVFIDNEDINCMEFVRLRSAVGYVPQDAALFSATIADNIAFGCHYERNEIVAAAQAAVVREDIDSKPEGFGVVLGEKGTRLSGGQRQRVAIARALIRKPALLLLDDVFSALDYKTQIELNENLRDLAYNRTVLLVSQRVAAVKQARFIIVLDEGHVAEQGTHEELIAAGGLYYKLYEQQLASGEL